MKIRLAILFSISLYMAGCIPISLVQPSSYKYGLNNGYTNKKRCMAMMPFIRGQFPKAMTRRKFLYKIRHIPNKNIVIRGKWYAKAPNQSGYYEVGTRNKILARVYFQNNHLVSIKTYESVVGNFLTVYNKWMDIHEENEMTGNSFTQRCLSLFHAASVKTLQKAAVRERQVIFAEGAYEGPWEAIQSPEFKIFVYSGNNIFSAKPIDKVYFYNSTAYKTIFPHNVGPTFPENSIPMSKRCSVFETVSKNKITFKKRLPDCQFMTESEYAYQYKHYQNKTKTAPTDLNFFSMLVPIKSIKHAIKNYPHRNLKLLTCIKTGDMETTIIYPLGNLEPKWFADALGRIQKYETKDLVFASLAPKDFRFCHSVFHASNTG